MEIRELIEKVIKDMERDGGLKSVVWVAAGGSHDGHYAAQYFMDRESTAVRSQQITSSEFVYAAPKCVRFYFPIRSHTKYNAYTQIII